MPGHKKLHGYSGPGEWAEIVGESVRGGAVNTSEAVYGSDDDEGYDNSQAQVMGAQFANNPAFQQMIARRVAASRPAIHNQQPVKLRDWQVGMSVQGSAGTTQTATVTPQVLFRAEKLMCFDINTTLNNPGTFTSIVGAFVGQRNQLPVGAGAGGALPSAAFASGALGNGIKWDTCQPAITIAIQVSFTQTGTWQAVLFGKTVA